MYSAHSTSTPTAPLQLLDTPPPVPTTQHRKGRKRAVIALGSLVGVAILVTSAVFTDFANLNLGASGIGTDGFNFQVVGTDPVTGAIIPDTWQEANTPGGAPIAIAGANSIFPGGPSISVDIPIRNDSTNINSAVTLGLIQLADTPTDVTSANYLASLRFQVTQPATSLNGSPIDSGVQSFSNFRTPLTLNRLGAGEESSVRVTITLLTQADSGSTHTDNSLNGLRAFLQANFNATSIT
ncbi:hypothetical protein [Lysinibacter sp. HNR]|uniref:hypothetical protein n=1 Tax=Lysinibacter sp. HNR TaxID=3031408 RepID=UPI002435E445|nr:hypothetical protein [Lysinibacter sp. HNR]WGD37922.1 hypothetical protein FrondiHNR_03130 [Lysinibacter sp. HNR]